jgi:fused signal recognition particle receptor
MFKSLFKKNKHAQDESDKAQNEVQLDAPEAQEVAPQTSNPPEKLSWLQRLKSGLHKSSDFIGGGISGIFTKRKLDAAAVEELEELLIMADLGVETASKISARIAKSRFDK